MNVLHASTVQPARIDAMVIVSATPRFPEALRVAAAQFTPEAFDRLSDEDRDTLRQRHIHGDDQIRALYAMTRASRLAALLVAQILPVFSLLAPLPAGRRAPGLVERISIDRSHSEPAWSWHARARRRAAPSRGGFGRRMRPSANGVSAY